MRKYFHTFKGKQWIVLTKSEISILLLIETDCIPLTFLQLFLEVEVYIEEFSRVYIFFMDFKVNFKFTIKNVAFKT